ncbi:hypothetical protein IW147_001746 [Coemansia sp. RSA 720]|nr:hypothetical protein IW147_001746 [Coemansia sp. RSA 720]
MDGIKPSTISLGRGHSPTDTSSGDTLSVGQQLTCDGNRQHVVSEETPRAQRTQAPGPSGGSKEQRPGSAVGLRCGTEVFIPTQGLYGTLRFLGPIDGKQGTWAGVELDEVGTGKNDGTVAGKTYFSCAQNTGIFVAPSKIEPCGYRQQQQHNTNHSENAPVRSISSVLSSGEKSLQTNRQLGLDSRARGHVVTPGPAQRAHIRQGSRSRIASDTQTSAGVGAMSSPLSNRRKTLTRGMPMALGAPPASQPRMRPPPATVSRGSSRTRPLSTTGSASSNRTSSPTLSRPNSQTLSQAVGTAGDATSTLSKPPPLARPRVYSGARSPNSQSAGAQTDRRRQAALPPGRPIDAAARGAGGRAKPGLAADSADRLKLRIDMLEAENRVLRLKGEQDKAHIAASQMLARDLAAVNGTVSPPARNVATSSDSNLLQLSDARDMLERERKASKTKIDQLQLQLQELHTNSSVDNAETSLLSPTTDNGVIAELQAELQTVTEAHLKELEVARSKYSEVSSQFEQSAALAAELQTKLDSKSDEIGALNERLEQRSSELGRAIQRYHELVEEREQQTVESSEELELIPVLEKQAEKLRRELAESETRRLAVTTDFESAASAQSYAEAEVSRLQHTVALLERSDAEHKQASALLAECRARILQMVTEAAESSRDDDGSHSLDASGDKEDVLQVLPALLERLQLLVTRLINRYNESSRHTDTLTADVQAKDALIAELSQQVYTSKDGQQSSDVHLQERIAELERDNAKHLDERERFTNENGVLTDYLEKLESECNRLVEDIEQLNTENLKLVEELRVASLHNSMVSLDISALDGSMPVENSDTGINELRQRHTHEMAALKLQIDDLEKQKDNEILRLQDEIASLEIIVEDKVFGEEELNDRIASLTDELGRLQRGQTDLPAIPAKFSAAASQQRSADLPAGATGAGVGTIVDDETLFCEICESSDHSIADCPEVTSASTIFKQETSVDSSRPYCDNCESFCGHWTEDCPHGDEMF